MARTRARDITPSIPSDKEGSEAGTGKSTKGLYTRGEVTEERENELAAIVAGAQELVRWEEALGAIGFPTAVVEKEAAPQSEGTADVEARLLALAEEAASCTRCELHRGRTKSVFARGTPNTDLVFVGEGPGYHEDQEEIGRAHV